METTMMYPVAYCVMTEEEMTYTEGGANLLQAVCAVAVPVYGWLAGVSAIRDYRKAHPTNWTSTGIDAWNKYMDKSLPEHHLRCRLCFLDSFFLLHWRRPARQCAHHPFVTILFLQSIQA